MKKTSLLPAARSQTKRSGLPPVVSADEWQAAREKLLAREKAMTRRLAALAAERRRQPMVWIAKDYVFRGPNGDGSFLDLFEGRRQLILYHFMFAPDVNGWPDAGCPGCSIVVDNVGEVAHLHARDTTFALVSRAPLKNLLRYKRRMGWTLPWYSSAGSDFNEDFGVTSSEGEAFGLSVFLQEEGRILPKLFHGRTWSGSAGKRLDVSRSDSAGAPRRMGGLSTRASAIEALPMVA